MYDFIRPARVCGVADLTDHSQRMPGGPGSHRSRKRVCHALRRTGKACQPTVHPIFACYVMVWYCMQCYGMVAVLLLWYAVLLVWYAVVWYGMHVMMVRDVMFTPRISKELYTSVWVIITTCVLIWRRMDY